MENDKLQQRRAVDYLYSFTRFGLNLYAALAILSAFLVALGGYAAWGLPLLVMALVWALLARWLKNSKRPGMVFTIIVLLVLFTCALGALATTVRW